MSTNYILHTDVEKVKSMLGNTYIEQYGVINYLIQEYENSEYFSRSICLNIQSFEFDLSDDLYDLLGIKTICYTGRNIGDSAKFYGNTDMLLLFPHFVELYESYPTYKFHVNGLGKLKIKDIKEDYIFKDTVDFDEYINILPYYFNFNYIYDSNIEFDDSYQFEFIKNNIDDYNIYLYASKPSELRDFLVYLDNNNSVLDLPVNDLSNLSDVEFHELIHNAKSKHVLELKELSLTIELLWFKDGVEDLEDKYTTLYEYCELFKDLTLNLTSRSLSYILQSFSFEELKDFISFLSKHNIKFKIDSEEEEYFNMINLVMNSLK